MADDSKSPALLGCFLFVFSVLLVFGFWIGLIWFTVWAIGTYLV